MHLIRENWLIVSSILFAAMLAFGSNFVSANPLFPSPTLQSATATTTQASMGFGTGTTTVTADMFYLASVSNTTGSGADVSIPNKALVDFQFTATSSVSTLDVRVEYSHDNIDWYSINSPLATTASTTPMNSLYDHLRFTSATSTTQGFGGSGTESRLHRSFEIPVYTRYVRAVFSLPSGSANGLLWAQISPLKELSR